MDLLHFSFSFLCVVVAVFGSGGVVIAGLFFLQVWHFAPTKMNPVGHWVSKTVTSRIWSFLSTVFCTPDKTVSYHSWFLQHHAAVGWLSPCYVTYLEHIPSVDLWVWCLRSRSVVEVPSWQPACPPVCVTAFHGHCTTIIIAAFCPYLVPQVWHQWQGCVNQIVAAVSMRTLDWPPPSQLLMRLVTSKLRSWTWNKILCFFF